MKRNKRLKLPGSNLEVKLSMYANDSTAILTNDSSAQKYFYWVKIFGKISAAKIINQKVYTLVNGKIDLITPLA